VNLEDPHQRDGGSIFTQDHVLDLWVEPDRAVRGQDEDELEAAVEAGRSTAGQAASFRDDGHSRRVRDRLRLCRSRTDRSSVFRRKALTRVVCAIDRAPLSVKRIAACRSCTPALDTSST